MFAGPSGRPLEKIGGQANEAEQTVGVTNGIKVVYAIEANR
jgi:hypothetical protein